MKVYTNIKTLKAVYATFKDAGIQGLLTGDAESIPASVVMDALIENDLMVEALKTITGSEKYVSDEGVESAWDEVPYAVLNGVLTDFFTGIGSA